MTPDDSLVTIPIPAAISCSSRAQNNCFYRSTRLTPPVNLIDTGHGSTVTLRTQTKDRFGRTVAEVFAQNGANAGITLVQQGNAFAYRQYLHQCDQWAYLDRERLAERYRLGVWRSAGGIERPWDFRTARRGLQSQPAPRPQRPVNLTIINGGATPSSGRRWYCRNVGSWQHAQQLLREGHTYLDGDGDGEACEALG